MKFIAPAYCDELCGDCRRRLGGNYCPVFERLMPDYVPACADFEGEGDE